MRPMNATKQIVYGAMIAALSVCSLLLAGVLPTGRLALLYLSSLFVYVLSERGCYVSAFAAFFAAAVVAFLIAPNKLICIPYAALLGHYGIMEPVLRRKLSSRTAYLAVLMLYCITGLALSYFSAVVLFDFDIRASIGISPLWLIPVSVALSAGFILLFGVCARFYSTKLAQHIK